MKSEQNFLEILKRNDEKEIQEFLLSFGKKPKPYCPFYIDKSDINSEMEENNNGETDNE